MIRVAPTRQEYGGSAYYKQRDILKSTLERKVGNNKVGQFQNQESIAMKVVLLEYGFEVNLPTQSVKSSSL